MKRALCGLALGCLAIAGCTPNYDHVEFRTLSWNRNVPAPTFTGSSIRIATGTIYAATVDPIASTNTSLAYRGFDLRSENPAILQVLRREDQQFVFVGAADGVTSVTVVVQSREVGHILASVIPQTQAAR